ncbi:MAG: hypothetical protein JXJ04_19835 [Spirochaetales bacterium]|nr:hypothetical protein [Spirochaetales bacterium]
MDEVIYFIGAIISVGWSLWLFTMWEKAGYGESSPVRFLLLFFPATCFLLISMSGWSSVFFLRLDILGLVLYFLFIILTWLCQFLTLPLHPDLYKKIYIVSLIIYLAGSSGIVGLAYILKSYPMAGISLFAFFKSFENIKGLKIIWFILNPETNKQDTFSHMNKLIIAFFSYLPLTLVRMWYTNRKFRQLKREIDILKKEMKDSSLSEMQDKEWL